jgi:hypothetical protein
MKPLPIYLILLFILSSITLPAQNNCPDLAVTEVRVDSMASPSPAYIRLRFVVVVQNTGRSAYSPSTSYGNTYINLNFTAPGYPDRNMARQNLSIPLTAGATDQMIFEVNVDRLTKTLPDWENMPLPQSYCGLITSDNVPATYECRLNNNSKCYPDKELRRIVR